MNNQVVVVIPFYKTSLLPYEEIALQQCFKVLRQYSIIAIKPRSLNLDYVAEKYAFSDVLSFDDNYFADIHGYNKLMLSAKYYGQFVAYHYLLVYQLDAFVFTDDLEQWCNTGYDYIGAPWLKKRDYRGMFDQWFNQLKNYAHVRFNIKYKNGLPKIGKQLENRVGNGGLSLRKVNLFLSCCEQYRNEMDQYLAMRHPWFNEDIFWCIALNRKKDILKIPKFDKAISFAFETYPHRAMKLNNGKLPFGCHAWDKHTDFWRPIFKQFGYEI